MRLKLKPAHLGIILILLFLGSMVPMIQRRITISLPASNIIDYELTQEQEDYAIRLRKTVMTFEYDKNCEACVSQKIFLENIATEQKDQIILQEIPANLTDSTRLRIISYYGEEILRNPNENEIWDVLCVLMFNPPTYCALREI